MCLFFILIYMCIYISFIFFKGKTIIKRTRKKNRTISIADVKHTHTHEHAHTHTHTTPRAQYEKNYILINCQRGKLKWHSYFIQKNKL